MKPSVAIAGATGNLGKVIAQTFLSEPWKSEFSRIVVLTRDANSEISTSLQSLGASLVTIDFDNPESLTAALQGIEIVVNVLGTKNPKAKDALLDAIVAEGSSVRVYFPSEFGVDHRTNGFDHYEWTQKAKHAEKARQEASAALKIIRVYTGLFLEDSIGPWFGFDVPNATFTSIGAPTYRITFTSQGDIGRSLVRLSLLAFAKPSSVPDHIHLTGTTGTILEIKDLVQAAQATDASPISLHVLDPATFSAEVHEKYKGVGDPSQYIRVLMSESKLDWSAGDNQLINPDEQFWEWKTLSTYLSEVKGRPWC